MELYYLRMDSGRLIVDDERAELGTGAMIIFIALILAATVVSSVIIMATEKMFQDQSNDAQTSLMLFLNCHMPKQHYQKQECHGL